MGWFRKNRRAIAERGSSGEAPGESTSHFTPHAQHVLYLARQEGARLNHNFVGTEHLLLGLIKMGQGVAVNVLEKLGLNLEFLQAEIESHVGVAPHGDLVGNPSSVPETPRVKKVLALAEVERKSLEHKYLGTEHILLGILREGNGVAGRVLARFGVAVDQVRLCVLKELDPNFKSVSDRMPAAPPTTTVATSHQPRSRDVPGSTHAETGLVDSNKRYDVYCSERNSSIVYRNVLFKGVRRLGFRRPSSDGTFEFVEIEMPDGQTVFLSRTSLIKFCEHGTMPNEDVL